MRFRVVSCGSVYSDHSSPSENSFEFRVWFVQISPLTFVKRHLSKKGGCASFSWSLVVGAASFLLFLWGCFRFCNGVGRGRTLGDAGFFFQFSNRGDNHLTQLAVLSFVYEKLFVKTRSRQGVRVVCLVARQDSLYWRRRRSAASRSRRCR